MMSEYLVYHDCGKPYCLTKNEKGNHFVDHAEKSSEIYLDYISNNQIVANLIKDDMVIHTETAEVIDQYLKVWTKKDAFSLVLSSISELHANSEHFEGGMNSLSFKMKWKQIDKRGRQIINYWKSKDGLCI
jgi:hypothetical protein